VTREEEDEREITRHEDRVAAFQECVFLIAVIVGVVAFCWITWTIR